MSNGTQSAERRIIMLPRIRRDQDLSAIAQLRTYWHALAAQPGVVPPRLAVQPRAIEAVLHVACLAERTGPGAVRVKVAGRTLVEALGTEPRNLPLTALFGMADKLRATDLVDEVFTRPGLLQMELHAPAARAEFLLMPLTDYLGKITMALGGFVLEGEAPGARGQFRIADARIDVLPAQPVTQPGCFAIDGIMAAAEAPAPFRGAPPRLVHSREE